MVFWKLPKKHKIKWLTQKLIIVLCVIAALPIAWAMSDVQMPTNAMKLSGNFSFYATVFIVIMAIFNRVNTLFKVKSVGFVFLFLVFSGISIVIQPILWTLGLIIIPLLIDDLVLTPIWANLWYNEYDGVVRIKE
mgnify:CR=1 FL=1